MPAQAPFDNVLNFGRSKPYLVLTTPNGGGTIERGIEFQFPPLVKTDSKGGNWQEFDLRQAEPLPLFKGGRPRQIDLRWSYIVNNQSMSGLVWDITAVERNVKLCRAYFYNQIGSELLIKFRCYDQVGGIDADSTDFDWTFRAENVDIQHSDTLIRLGEKVFPLRTDISMKLMFYVNLAKTPEGVDTSFDGLDQQEKVKVVNIKTLPTVLAWF